MVIYFIYRIQHMHNPSVQRRKEGNIDVMRCNHLYWKKNITTKQSNKYVQNQYLWSYLMGMAERLKKGIFWTKQTQAKPGSYLQISKHMNKLFKTLSQMISTCSGCLNRIWTSTSPMFLVRLRYKYSILLFPVYKFNYSWTYLRLDACGLE
jgi:hypothetical protein